MQKKSGGEWWFYEDGQNTLKGVEGDLDNPPVLSADIIIHLLLTIPEARSSFDRVVPTMLPEEQDRLWPLKNEGVATSLALDYKAVNDNFQKAQNTAGVRTCGPRGGGSWAPPPYEEPT